jgi:hypothetical protein
MLLICKSARYQVPDSIDFDHYSKIMKQVSINFKINKNHSKKEK